MKYFNGEERNLKRLISKLAFCLGMLLALYIIHFCLHIFTSTFIFLSTQSLIDFILVLLSIVYFNVYFVTFCCKLFTYDSEISQKYYGLSWNKVVFLLFFSFDISFTIYSRLKTGAWLAIGQRQTIESLEVCLVTFLLYSFFLCRSCTPFDTQVYHSRTEH